MAYFNSSGILKKFSILYRIFLLLILFSLLSAENTIDEKVTAGIHAFYNYETQLAIDILTQTRKDGPEHPAVHLTWVTARWLHSQANDEVENSYRRLEQDLDEIIPVYEALIQQYPDNPRYRLFYGTAVGLNARISLGKKEWISTLIHAWKGFRIIRKVHNEHPELVDAQLPIGIVEYYAGLSNVLVKTAVSLFGLETTKESGIKKIELAANSGEYAWIEAQSILSFLYTWVLDSPGKALNYSHNLTEHFPKNYYFNIMYLESLINTGKLKEAGRLESYLKQYLEVLTPVEQSWYSGYIDYESALLNYHLGNLDISESLVAQAVDNYGAELDIVLANALLLKGKLNDLKGRRTEAVSCYTKCIELNNFSSAVVNAKEYLDSPFVK